MRTMEKKSVRVSSSESDQTMPTPLPNWFRQAIQITGTVLMLLAQVMRRIRLRLRSRMALAAEHLFLQKQSALYQAHNAVIHYCGLQR